MAMQADTTDNKSRMRLNMTVLKCCDMLGTYAPPPRTPSAAAQVCCREHMPTHGCLYTTQ
jgi:hypothetical protein